MPLFKKILCIIVSDDKADPLTSEVSTLYFDEHLNAVRVGENRRPHNDFCLFIVPNFDFE